MISTFSLVLPRPVDPGDTPSEASAVPLEASPIPAQESHSPPPEEVAVKMAQTKRYFTAPNQTSEP